MQRRSVAVGVRVAPYYNDGPLGTIEKVVNEAVVWVKWDSGSFVKTKELVKFLRKV